MVKSPLYDCDVRRAARDRYDTTVGDNASRRVRSRLQEAPRQIKPNDPLKPQVVERARTSSATAKEIQYQCIPSPCASANGKQPTDELAPLLVRRLES